MKTNPRHTHNSFDHSSFILIDQISEIQIYNHKSIMNPSSKFLMLSIQPVTLSLNIINTTKKTKRSKWTLEDFLQQARLIHPDKYDYSLVTRENIKGYNSYIPVRCLTCDSCLGTKYQPPY
jgi:predicted nucleic acid binding AN1-type Zn finger protein